MRLRRLDLTRYGKFTDQVIDFGPAPRGVPDLHIVYGLNEAGKSTALSAYLDLLFGIEHNSRYGFLHPYGNMQVGAELEFGGAAHQLVRVKARTNSLLDGRGQPLSEALLSVPLAGLTRESYRAMFSLDDQSLEDGGNAILASRGELGELLFSASAGLADLGTTLARVREQADAIHKPRGRSTQIAELKRRLAELKTEQDAIDTRASAYAALVAERAQAEVDYATAVAEQAAARARQEQIARLLRAAPLAAAYERVRDEMAQFGALPTPPAEWDGQLSGLMIRNAELGTQIAGTESDLARLDTDLAALVIDTRLLAQGEAIGGLGEGLARFSTAEADLPRRQAAIAEDEAAIAAILNGLGQPGHGAPEALVLPAALVGTLRDLIEARSGIEARAETARRELVQAREAVERATDAMAASAGGKAPQSGALDGVQAALATLRRSDHQARIRVAERALPQMARRYEAQREGLAPWSGDGDGLRAVRLPEARQIEGWRTRASAIDRRTAELQEKTSELLTRQREDIARIAAIHAMAGAIDDLEAARLRTLRDAAWAAHARSLNAQSASAFLAALAADDALAGARLAHVQDLAELRRLQQSLAVTEASLGRQDEMLAGLETDRSALEAEIIAVVAGQITLPKATGVAGQVEFIDSWSRRRGEALSAWDALQETEGDAAAAKADLLHDLAVLAEAMTLAGFDAVDELSPDALLQAAEAALTEGGSRLATRAAAEKSLAERQGDLRLREQALREADAAISIWQQDWEAALTQSWIAESGVGAVRELLARLAELPAALTQRNARARQVETMARDQQDFARALGSVLAELGETLDPDRIVETARSLGQRHEIALRDERSRLQKSAEQSRLVEIRRALMQDLAVHGARKVEMTGFFGVETLEEVSAQMARVAARTQLARQRETLERQILAELRTDSVETALAQVQALDLAVTEQEAAETTARLEDLEATSRQRFAALSRARDRLAAIGGDDAVARIEAQRRTLLLQIEDKAMDYLRLRTGALMAEQAVRAYREQHRSAMLERASAAFALITRGDYAGLAAQPDKDRESLMGLTRQGGSKLAADMSKGTRFQLYLALRLAGYEEFAHSRPSVPFIADDIMETFDEPRSEQVFRLLAEMAGIGQVIYLTHHRHLCTIAKAVLPGVTVHELG